MSEASTEITIYSTTWCAFCHTEAQWLDHLGIPYVKKDIEQDKEAYDELMKKSEGNFSGVPITDVGGKLIVGFDRPKLMEAMESVGLKPKK